MPTAKLLAITPNPTELLKTACSKPYGRNIGDKTLQAIIKSGHLSIMEHASATLEITCSVRVLGQLTRHRHFSFTCKSARGSSFDEGYDPIAKETFPALGHESYQPYFKALEEGMDEQDAAYLLPQGAETTIVMTGNFRSWYEYLPKRMCLRAMPEHRDLACLIQKELAKACPEIFDREFMKCNQGCTEGSCKFK